MNNNMKIFQKDLRKPFSFDEVEWRIQSTFIGHNNKPLAVVVPYIRSRLVMNRLDEVFGIDGWYNEYKPWNQTSQLCGISVLINNKWITKWDGAEQTEISSTKGGLSNSLKRAAVLWGIGRYIYNLGTFFADVEEPKPKKYVIAKTSFSKLEQEYVKKVNALYREKIFDINTSRSFNTDSIDSNYQNSSSKNTRNQSFSSFINDEPFENRDNHFNGNYEKKDVATISSACISFIEKQINNTNVTLKSILDFYKVASLSELNINQANDLLSTLSKEKS